MDKHLLFFIGSLNLAFGSRSFGFVVENTKLNREFAKLLLRNNLITHFSLGKSLHGIEIYLDYVLDERNFLDVRVYSRPGHKVYWRLDKLRRHFSMNCNSLLIIKHRNKLYTIKEACMLNKGGEVLAEIF